MAIQVMINVNVQMRVYADVQIGNASLMFRQAFDILKQSYLI
jgi:hypothetical protein